MSGLASGHRGAHVWYAVSPSPLRPAPQLLWVGQLSRKGGLGDSQDQVARLASRHDEIENQASVLKVRVLARVAAHLRDDGIIVVGLGLDRGYSLADVDAPTATIGLEPEHRFATWDVRPWQDDAPFAVTVPRRPEPT